jgi:hypothetical protein
MLDFALLGVVPRCGLALAAALPGEIPGDASGPGRGSPWA